MRTLMPLFLLVLASTAAATAQDQSLTAENDAQSTGVATFVAPDPAAGQLPTAASRLNPWEIGIGFQLNDFRPPSSVRFHTSGLNVSVSRFFNDWFAVEGQVGAGFGHTGKATFPPNLTVKNVFFGGGPRFAYRRSDSRWEPWGHFLIGLEHFRFPTGPGFGGINTLGFLVGPGVDYRVSDRFALRGEVDYLGTRLFRHNDRGYQIVAGAVFNF